MYESEIQMVETADLEKPIRLILLPNPRKTEASPH
jgi:hypothetical protein